MPRGVRPELPSYTHVEIESLPSGMWGYTHFPLFVRYFQPLGKELLGMTARFHKSWADFGGLKPRAALEYETGQMVAHGARCSIGDQMHPRGTLDKGAYQLIGQIYQRIAQREPWLEGATSHTQVAVLQAEERPVGMGGRIQVSEAEQGAVRMLTQLKHQFDLIDAEEDFGRYELLVLPDSLSENEALIG